MSRLCCRSVRPNRRSGKRSIVGQHGVLIAAVLATAATMPGNATPARADDAPSWLAYAAAPSRAAPANRPPAAKDARAEAEKGDVDTEHIFGFSMGSDIGEKGERELEIESVGLMGKRSGTYFSSATLNLVKYTLTDTFRIAPGVIWGGNKIKDVPGFSNRDQVSIEGAAFEMRFKLLDRETMPFGLTLHIQPGWNRVDEATGLRVEQYGSEFALLADKEFIENQLWGTINLWYGAGASRDVVQGGWSHDSDIEVHAGLSARVSPILILGGELRYARAYEGMGLDRLKGEALYLGPTISLKLTKNSGLSGTINFQVAGKAVGDTRSLDLQNYERMQAILRYNFCSEEAGANVAPLLPPMVRRRGFAVASATE